MITPVYYIVSPEQIGKEDLGTYLRRAIELQFQSKEYYISKELIEEKVTPYSNGQKRKIRSYSINEANKYGHLICFDITNCTTGDNLMGR